MVQQLELLKKCLEFDEGKEYWPYDDETGRRVKAPRGNITIGIGHNLEGRPLSDKVMQTLLEEDIDLAESDAADIYRHFYTLSVARQHALTMMSFQMGKWRLLKFYNTNRAINEFQWKLAEKHALDSEWARHDSPERARRVIHLLVHEQYKYPDAQL